MHKLSKIVLSGKFTYGSRETELLAKAAQDQCIEIRGCAYKLFTMQRKKNHWDVSPFNGNFIKPFATIFTLELGNNKGTQRQFLENICSEDDLRSRIFGT